MDMGLVVAVTLSVVQADDSIWMPAAVSDEAAAEKGQSTESIDRVRVDQPFPQGNDLILEARTHDLVRIYGQEPVVARVFLGHSSLRTKTGPVTIDEDAVGEFTAYFKGIVAAAGIHDHDFVGPSD